MKTERRLWPDECVVYFQRDGFLSCQSRLRGVRGRFVSHSCCLPKHLNYEYSVFSPFFEKITIELDVPSADGWRKRKLTIIAPGARTKPYIKSLTINGERIESPVIRHSQLVGWETDLPEVKIVFEMSDKIERWGNEKEVLETLGISLEEIGSPEAVLNSPLHEEL